MKNLINGFVRHIVIGLSVLFLKDGIFRHVIKLFKNKQPYRSRS